MFLSLYTYKLKNQGVWGTHVELLAATDYYQIPVYILCTVHRSTGKLTYTWHIFNSQPSRYSPSTSFRANCLPLPFTKDHIELAHSADHYDSVVPCTGDQTPLSLPNIITKESDTILMLEQLTSWTVRTQQMRRASHRYIVRPAGCNYYVIRMGLGEKRASCNYNGRYARRFRCRIPT